jgi:O-antigen/teichoic acid export membrane protein
VAALIVLLFYWRKNKRRTASFSLEGTPTLVVPQNGNGMLAVHVADPANDLTKQEITSYEMVSYRMIIKKVVAYAIPISLGALVLPLFQLMDSLTIPRILSLSGWETDLAKQARGIYARGHPLVQFAAFFATALSLALVPSISEAKARHHLGQIVNRAQAALKLTFLVGLGAAVGLAVLARPINIMFYMNDDGTTTIAVLAFVAIFSTLSMTSGAVLQGMGYVTLPARHLLVGVGVKTVLNVLLLPFLGITGAALASVAGYLTAASLNIRSLYRMLPLTWLNKKAVLWPLAAALFMGVVVGLVKWLLLAVLPPVIAPERLLNLLVTLLCLPVGVAVYGMFLLRLGILTRQELSLIPRLERIVPYLEKMKIIGKEG